MKKYFFSFFLFLIVSIAWAQLGVMTYNIKYNNPADGSNSWDNRKQDVLQLLNYYQPDLLGTQEGLLDQLQYIKQNMESYDYVGGAREDGAEKGEFSAIFYQTQRLKLIETETYWLSETPNIPSKGWDAALNRIVTYAVFKDKKNKETLYVFNTHFDHIGEEARQNSARLILRLIDEKKLESQKIIVMGDLNSQPKDVSISLLSEKLKDSYTNSLQKPYGPIGTFNGFDTNIELKNRIDYIFLKNYKSLEYRTIDDRRPNNLYPSDHLPVWVLLK